MPENFFDIVYAVLYVVGSIVRGVYTRGCRREAVREQRRRPLDMLFILFASLGLLAPLAYLLTPWLGFADYALPAAAGWVGTVLLSLAIWLLWRSHVDLGRNWSAIPRVRQEHSLVTHGVFGRIRHPMYAAHWLWAVAQALLLGNWVAGYALLVAFVPFYLVRVPLEERLMLDHFGQEYQDYMDRTGRVLPRLGQENPTIESEE